MDPKKFFNLNFNKTSPLRYSKFLPFFGTLATQTAGPNYTLAPLLKNSTPIAFPIEKILIFLQIPQL